MVALIQRVSEATVSVDGIITGAIGPGMLVFLGIHQTDTSADIPWLARKCANLRIFGDENGIMNLSALSVGAEILVVSQFTLQADIQRGNRPSYINAARPELAEPLYEQFLIELEELLSKHVPRGIFGASMKVSLVNDGPVTLWIEKS